MSDGRRSGDGGGGFQRGATGSRPEEEDATRSYQTKVKQQMTKGKIQVTGEVFGKQTKGESSIDVQGALEAGYAEQTDALTKQRIPREHQNQLKEYYQQIRGESK